MEVDVFFNCGVKECDKRHKHKHRHKHHHGGQDYCHDCPGCTGLEQLWVGHFEGMQVTGKTKREVNKRITALKHLADKE